MNRDIPAKNIILEMDIDGVYYPVFCAQTLEHVLEQDEIETTHVNSGPNREYVPGMSNSTITTSGLSRINNEDGKISVFYLMQQSVRRQIQSLRVRASDNDSPVNNVSVTFNGFIKSTSYDKPVPALSKSYVTFRVSGPLTFSDVIAPPEEPVCEVQDPLYIDAVAGETSVHSDLLEADGVEILSVARSGDTHHYTSGTPGSLEYSTDLANGDILFDPTNPLNSGEVIYVLYKVTA